MRTPLAALAAAAFALRAAAAPAGDRPAPAASEPAAASGIMDHAAFSALLERYVDTEGRVAYRDLAADGRPALERYLAELATAAPDGWPRADRIAFWINAYNAAILRAVLDGYSAERVWSRYALFYRFTQPIAGEPRTPDRIENRILRPAGEHRIHFALVCASTSCPTLRRHAWTGAGLDGDLEAAAVRFVRDPARNHIRTGEPTIRISPIFQWYRDDFGGSDDTVRAVLARYADEPERRYLLEQQPAVAYLDYDWTLNAQPGQRPDRR